MVATRDHHVDPGDHFAAPPAVPDYVHSWPAHCVAGTEGVGFHPNFAPAVASGAIDAVFDKGAYEAAYSGFEGADENGVRLADWLREREVTEVDVVGIATDHCVRATALDAAREGFVTRVLLDLTAGVAAGTTERALEELRTAGVELAGKPVVRQGRFRAGRAGSGPGRPSGPWPRRPQYPVGPAFSYPVGLTLAAGRISARIGCQSCSRHSGVARHSRPSGWCRTAVISSRVGGSALPRR